MQNFSILPSLGRKQTSLCLTRLETPRNRFSRKVVDLQDLSALLCLSVLHGGVSGSEIECSPAMGLIQVGLTSEAYFFLHINL